MTRTTHNCTAFEYAEAEAFLSSVQVDPIPSEMEEIVLNRLAVRVSRILKQKKRRSIMFKVGPIAAAAAIIVSIASLFLCGFGGVSSWFGGKTQTTLMGPVTPYQFIVTRAGFKEGQALRAIDAVYLDVRELYVKGDYDGVLNTLKISASVLSTSDPTDAIKCRLRNMEGVSHFHKGNFIDADRIFEETIRVTNDPDIRAILLVNRSSVAIDRPNKDFSSARALLAEAENFASVPIQSEIALCIAYNRSVLSSLSGDAPGCDRALSAIETTQVAHASQKEDLCIRMEIDPDLKFLRGLPGWPEFRERHSKKVALNTQTKSRSLNSSKAVFVQQDVVEVASLTDRK